MTKNPQEIIRCAWAGTDPLYNEYHDQEWGKEVHNDHIFFEFLILEGAQAGLSWETVLKKRENYRSAFDQFDAKIISQYGPQKKACLLENPGIIRNRLKIDSVVHNAKMLPAAQDECCTVDK